MRSLPGDFIEKLRAVKSKRPATVIRHILEHGFITSEELERLYGYKHPPRAVRDVRELGIPIETYRVKSSDGRTIAAYRFGNPGKSQTTESKVAGRTVLSKALKKALIKKYGSKCAIYMQPVDENELQIDHRIPYEIGGEQDNGNVENYMLISRSANRAKSWSCEHCRNWTAKDVTFCTRCFWAHPENYSHIAGKEERRIIITFTGNEIEDYNKLIEATGGRENAGDIIRNLIKEHVKGLTGKNKSHPQ